MKVFKICKRTDNGLEERFVGVPTAKDGKALSSEFPPLDVTEQAKKDATKVIEECNNPAVKALIIGGEY